MKRYPSSAFVFVSRRNKEVEELGGLLMHLNLSTLLLSLRLFYSKNTHSHTHIPKRWTVNEKKRNREGGRLFFFFRLVSNAE